MTLKVNAESNQLVLWQRGYTGSFPCVLSILVGGLGLVLGVVRLATGQPEPVKPDLCLYWGGGLVVGGFLGFLRAPQTTVTLSRTSGQVHIRQRGWLFSSESVRSLANVKTAILEPSTVDFHVFPVASIYNFPNWSLQLLFETDGPIELLTNFEDKKDAETAHRAVCTFLALE
jgi:hypothetical protein